MPSWSSKEWKLNRLKAIEGKVCAWCGSSVALAVHHDKEPRVTGLAKWKSIYRSLDKSPNFKNITPEQLKELTDIKFNAWRAEYEKIYMDFKNVIILCQKCHFALHKGKKLCNKCKIHYHNPRYPMCFVCNEKAKSKTATSSPANWIGREKRD